MEQNIENLRREIDGLDRQLVQLLTARMEVSARVAEYKKSRGLPVLAPEREQLLLEKVGALAGEEHREAVCAVYGTVLAQSRSLQKRLGCGVFGLLGETLGHSFSPKLHSLLADYRYELFEKKPEELEHFLREGRFDGLNVTIPYKKSVIPFCARLTEQASRIGSVNTILRQPDGSLLGHNTDYDGFRWLLARGHAEPAGKKALVLGSGGASLTVQTVLKELGAEVAVISRSGPDNYGNLDRHRDARYLVNATPVGMYPHNGERPVDLDRFPELEGVFDLIYNPAKTQLVLDAERRGIPALGGLPMLTAQARAAAELFLERPIPESRLEAVNRRLEKETRNLLLIGMPGCGKTTVGRALAKKLSRAFVDLDEAAEQRAGMKIPELFRTAGEEAFRRLEHEVLLEVSRESGLVIAAGGGVVTRRENLDPMEQNSTVIFLRRPLKELPTAGRPLSQRGNLEELYRTRLPLYEEAARLTVDNTGAEETAAEIIRRLEL